MTSFRQPQLDSMPPLQQMLVADVVIATLPDGGSVVVKGRAHLCEVVQANQAQGLLTAWYPVADSAGAKQLEQLLTALSKEPRT